MVTESVVRDIATVARIGAVPSILQMVCTATGMRFAAVARVTEDTWTACAVRDEIDFGLKPGGELPLKTTICDEIRASGRAIIIDHVSEDPHFRTHHTPRMYGFQSYISVPITRTNGEFFGTLCALDPLPAKVSDAKVIATFELFCQLISGQTLAHVIAELAALHPERRVEARIDIPRRSRATPDGSHNCFPIC